MSHMKKHMTRRVLEPRTYRRPREYSDHLAIGPHGKPMNSTISRQRICTPSKVCGLLDLSDKMWIQTPMRGFNFVTKMLLLAEPRVVSDIAGHVEKGLLVAALI